MSFLSPKSRRIRDQSSKPATSPIYLRKKRRKPGPTGASLSSLSLFWCSFTKSLALIRLTGEEDVHDIATGEDAESEISLLLSGEFFHTRPGLPASVDDLQRFVGK